MSTTLLSHWAKKTAQILMVYTCLAERTAPFSAFKGSCKAGPLRQLKKNPRFHIAYKQLGVEWNIQPQTLEQLEQLTCLIHGHSQDSSVDVVRTKLLHNMFGEDPKLTTMYKGDRARLFHCQFPLKPHIQCVNLRAALYNQRSNLGETVSVRRWVGMGEYTLMIVGTGVISWSYHANLARRYASHL